jgi:uncharacterized repeat protein (TIGR03803 family)
LILSGDTLYGTASFRGNSTLGTVFALNTNGTGFTTLYGFTNGNDGSYPRAGLVLSGNTLYGTASSGGTNGYGTAFALSTNGTGFTTLHSFSGSSDGGEPQAGLILWGNTLYGTTTVGGNAAGNSEGTIFAVNTNGTGFTTLLAFTWSLDAVSYMTNSDGEHPGAGLILSANTLYGEAADGGPSGDGTVFSLFVPGPPQLGIVLSGANVILTWKNTATGFTLESTASLASPAWSTVSPAPVIVNGQYTVTNAIAGTAIFYQLNQ